MEQGKCFTASCEDCPYHEKAVAILQPLIEADKQEGVRSAGKVLMATVKGMCMILGRISYQWSWLVITMKL